MSMGLYLKQEESNTELSQKIKAELRRKAEISREVDSYETKNLSKSETSDDNNDSAVNNPVGRFIIAVSVGVLAVIIYFLAVK